MGLLTDSYNKYKRQQGENSAAGSNTSTEDEEKKVTVIGKVEETEENSGPKNVGGFGGGLEYLGTKFVDGLVSNIEGIVDFVAGGIAEIRGNDEKAQEIFQNDWYNYNRADEKYNPGTGMKVAGDLTGVLGGAAPDIGLGLVLAAAGASTGLAMLLGAGLSFTSGSGRGINEAVNKTGELGNKEWAGGMGSGALAAGIELISGGIGAATGGMFGKATTEIGMEIGESFSKKASSKAIGGALGEIAEEGSEATAKNIIKKIFSSKTGKELVGEMVSEGIEESIETFLEPAIKQNTYDPDAPNASVGDVAYSFLLGAAAGGLIEGGKIGISSAITTRRGAKISADSTKMNNLMHNAQAVSNYESEKQTGSEVFQAVTNLYNEVQQRLAASGGKPTMATMEKIGELDRMVTTAVLVPSMVNAAKGIAQNAQSTVDALNNFYKKTGQDSITVEQLTAGLVTDKGGKAFVRSVEKAMSENGLLRTVVINNMLGRMEFDAQSFANSIYGDIDISSIATQQNLNRFLSTADAATINQLGAALGISNWTAVTPEDLAARIKAFRDSGQAELHRGGYEAIEKAKRAKGYTNGMPTSVSALAQGATRFKTDKADFAIIREGDKFRLYDFETGHVTNAMSLADMEAIVARLKQRAAEIDAESEMAALDRELNDFANENVPEYKKLTEAEKEAVRATLRSARANGISVKDQILFARIAAKSGLNIIVDPTIEADKPARYDGRNSIYINPKSPRTRLYSGLLGHEVFHKMFRSSKIKRLFMQAWNNLDEAKRDSVTKQYMAEEQKERSYDSARRVSAEEVAAAYAEEVFNNPGVWEYILSEEPSLKDRVIAFFKGAPKRYSFAPEMDAAAKKWLQEYKKIFDKVAARNAGMNVVEDVTTVDKKEQIKKIGKLVDELGGTATQVPKKVIKKIGKLVPDENAESNKKTASGTKVQDSGERFAAARPKFSDYDKPITFADVEAIHKIYERDEKLSINKFTAEDIEATQKWAYKFYKELGVKSPFFRAWFGDWRAYDHSPVNIVEVDNSAKISSGNAINADTGRKFSWSKDIAVESALHAPKAYKGDMLIIASNLPHIVEKSILLDTVVSNNTSNKKLNGTSWMHSLYAVVNLNGKNIVIKLFAEEAYSQKQNQSFTRAYSLKYIQKVAEFDNGVHSNKGGLTDSPSATTYSIADLYDFVKTYDKDFTSAPEISPLLLNDDGTPKVFYHGTRENFTTFELQDKAKFGRALGDGFYFTSSYDKAFKFANGLFSKGQDRGGIIMPVYLHMKNPYVIEADADRRNWAKEYNAGDYDGIIDLKNDTYYVEGQTQIKSATDNVGTFSSYEPDIRYALADGKRATAGEVAAVKSSISKKGIDPKGIIAIADKYFARYSGQLTRTGVRYEFLAAADMLFDLTAESGDRAYASVEALAEELVTNEKDTSGMTEDIKEMKRHIREITFEVRERDKGEFDSVGGYAQFRKDNFGRLKLANDGASVDSVYAELQNLYGTSYFPELNTVGEMLIRIAEVMNMEPDVRTETDAELEVIKYETAVSIMGELAEAFNVKIPEKSQRLSKSDAEAFKKRANAKAETKAAKEIARAKKRLEQIESKMRTKLRAEYETDRVFSESGVKKRLATIDGYKALPASERSDIESRIWTELNESDGYDAREWIGLNWTTKLTDRLVSQKGEAVSRAERYEIYKQVDDTIRSIIGSGKESVRGRMESEIRKELPDKIKAEANAKNDIRAEIYQTLKKIDDKKTGRFASASEYKGRTFKGSIENLTKMDWRGRLNDKIVRREIGNLNQWYEVNNPMLKDFESKELNTTPFQESIKRRLEILADGEGELTVEELQMLSEVMTYFTKLMDEYDMVYTEGKWQSGTDIVYKYRDTIEKQKKIRLPMFIRVLRNRLLSGDLRAFGDPLSIMKLADLYEDGIFTRIYNDWLHGEINAGAEAMDIKSEYDAFMKDKNNKNYLAKAKDQKVELHGVKIDKLQLISYVMTLKRKGSWLGVANGGVVFRTEDGQDVEMHPIAPMVKGRDYNSKLEAAIGQERSLAESLLSDQDKQYMQILERGFERARQTKAAGDMQRLGFVNVIEGYYYPIRRAYTDHISEFEADMFATDRYANASFNKKTIEEAKSALLIGSADLIFNSHVDGVARYMYLSPVIDSFNKLFKLKVLKTKPGLGADLDALYKLQNSTFSLQSLVSQSDSTWRQNGKIVGFDYLQNLMLDTMGRKNDRVGSDLAGLLRGGYVSFALGGNVKVLATQFSSLIASRSILKFGTHLQGITLKGKDVDTYSTVAKLRDSDYDLLKTMGVTDRVNNFAKWFSRGMSFMDRVVVKRVFAAAQAQVARNGGPKIGTEENLIAAGKLTDKIILETQQNAFASRKTEAARRGNELYKTAMMFKSDSVTMMGRVIDAYGEMQYLKSQKSGADAEGKKKINAKIKKVNKSLNKAVGSVVGSAIFMLMLGELFKNLYGKADKDETEEERARRLSVEFVGNLVGGIPALSSVMEFFASGYDLESMEFSAINDILGTAKDAMDMAADAAAGKTEGKDLVKMGEKLVYTFGQATGIPVRNLKNFAWGVTNLISGKTSYKWNDLTKSQSYSKDLSDAIDHGDYDLAAVIVELGLGDKMGSGLSDKAIGELVRLGKTGEKVIPSAVSDKITVDGEEIELSGKELKAVREKYSEAVDMVNMIIESDIYKSFDDEAKADAVNKIYTLYKNLAYDSVIGSKKDEEAYILSKIVDSDILCLNELTYMQPSDKDEKGNTISGSKRGKVVAAINGLDISEEEKLLLIATHGYGLKDGDVGGMNKTRADRVLFNYIASLGLTEEEMLKLYEYAGYDVENGKVSGSAAVAGSGSSTSRSTPTLGGSRSGSSRLGGSSGRLGGSSRLGSATLGSTTRNRVKRLGKLV